MKSNADPTPPAHIPLVVRHVLPTPAKTAAPSSFAPHLEVRATPASRPTLAGMIAATALALLALSFGASSAPAATGGERARSPEALATSQAGDTTAAASTPTFVSVGPVRTNPPGAAGEVLALLLPAKASASACVDLAIASELDLHGGLELAWDIRGGRVTDLTLVRDTTGSRAIQECLLRTVRAIRFPADLDVHVKPTRWTVTRGSVAREVLPVRDYGGY